MKKMQSENTSAAAWPAPGWAPGWDQPCTMTVVVHDGEGVPRWEPLITFGPAERVARPHRASYEGTTAMTETSAKTTKCPTCGGAGKFLMFYSRGPNSPPGNAYSGCPDCPEGRTYMAALQAEVEAMQNV